jgi:hypothetical protein
VHCPALGRSRQLGNKVKSPENLAASVAVPDVLEFTSDAPDGYPNGRLPSDRTTDLPIQLIPNLPSFTDGTQTKTYCPTFLFLRPPLQLSAGPPFDYDSNPQTCD